jgi:formate dehydrogenase subunit beta
MAQSVSMKPGDRDLSTVIAEFLKTLVKNEMVDALFVPRILPTGGMIVPALVTDPDRSEGIVPLAPVMPVNAATELAKLTRTLSDRKIGAFLHPCELRAYIELVKLHQGERHNCILITSDCYGAYSTEDFTDRIGDGGTPDRISSDFITGALSGAEDLPLRKACTVCDHPEALQADIHVRISGMNDSDILYLEALTKAGGEILESLDIGESAVPGHFRDTMKELRESRLTARRALMAEVEKSSGDIHSLMKTLEKCINCKNCRDLCPVCYCRECVFDTPLFEHDSELYLSWAQKKHSLRMPAETLFFHLTRMNHMAALCVGCGMCTEACPNDIPVADLFQLAGEKVQKIFDYVPGRDMEEEIPFVVFKEEELEPR